MSTVGERTLPVNDQLGVEALTPVVYYRRDNPILGSKLRVYGAADSTGGRRRRKRAGGRGAGPAPAVRGHLPRDARSQRPGCPGHAGATEEPPGAGGADLQRPAHAGDYRGRVSGAV